MNRRNSRIVYKSQTNAVDYAYMSIAYVSRNNTYKK